MATAPIADIVVGERHRKEMGDIAALVDSIRTVGLLHPIVISPTGKLIAGHRRLEAVKRLGWTEVPVTVAATLTEAAAQVRAEWDENTCRKDFTPSEAVFAGRPLEALVKPKAEERKAATQAKPGVGRVGSGNLPAPETTPRPRVERETRTVVAKAVGMGARSYDKAKKVVEVAEDPAKPEPVRRVAKQAMKEMDATGKVDAAYRKVQKAEFEADPVTKLIESDADIARAKYRKAAMDARVKASDLTTLDPEKVAASVLDDADWDLWLSLGDRITAWFEQLRKARPRPGLRVMSGGK